jgi:hypothetical protein
MKRLSLSDNSRQELLPSTLARVSTLDRYWRRIPVLALSLAGTCFAQSWGSVGVGYNALLTEGGLGNWTTSHGLYALPTFNINEQIGVFADFPNFYSKGQNVHGDVFGPLHAFGNETRYTPFVFVGIGDIRDSRAGNVTNSFGFVVGGGLLIRLTRWVSFQTIPIEYVMNTANSQVGNNFVARAGLALTIPKKSE